MASIARSSTRVMSPTYRRGYSTYISPYGPKYKVQPNIAGWTIQSAAKLGITLGAFGGVAGVFALFFFADIPRVRKDIMQKVPVIGPYFIREIPASDNPF